MKLLDPQASGYKPPSDSFDEMLTPQGSLRPVWSDYLSMFDALGPRAIRSRWESVRRLIRENGVTFNVHGSKDGLDRMWELDPFPLIISGQEWGLVERGLAQRARLLEMLLDDVYGEQRCLKERWLPSQLVLGHPGFLRPCHGIKVPHNKRLLLYSVDLARSPGGGLMALRDRAEAPIGCGYALENRLALTRMMPELFQGKQVRKLAPFFRTLREGLAQSAQRPSPAPRIVLLTPGTHSPTFFEQAYLAQFLGFDLVQGDDLTVRDNRVYLKLLEGLQPVDVILKRLTDPFCDPLELRSDTVIGVPGLVQALRSQNVTMANSLGSAWVETPALHAFMPSLCRRLLGEDLMIPSVRTWWCGDPESLRYVLDHFERLVIKPTFLAGNHTALFPEEESEEKKLEIRARLLKDPSGFVAQERLELSTTPCWREGGLDAGRLVMRTFTTRDRDSYVVMPGALSVVSRRPETLAARLGEGAQSKDTWIVDESDEVGEAQELMPRVGQAVIELSRGGGDIPSRAADDLYWLGRTLERAEGLCRILRYCTSHLNEEPGVVAKSEIPRLLHFINPRWSAPSGEREDYVGRIQELLSVPHKVGGLRPTMDSIHRLLGAVRDRISAESWRLSNHLHNLSQERPASLADSQTMLDDLLMTFSAFSGMVSENMTRNHSWRFMDMGRRIERAIYTVGLLKRTLCPKRQSEEYLLEAVLEVADVSRTYRWRYPAGLQAAPFLDLLLADESNPRSVACQLQRLDYHFQELPGRSRTKPPGAEELLLLKMRSEIRLADIHQLTADSVGKRRTNLTNLLRDLNRDLPALSDLVVQRYLTHLAVKPQGPVFGREMP